MQFRLHLVLLRLIKMLFFTMLKHTLSKQLVIMPTTNSAYANVGGAKYCDEKSQLTPVSKYAKDKVEVEED